MEESWLLHEVYCIGLFNMELVWLKGSLARKGLFGSHSEERQDARLYEFQFPGKSLFELINNKKGGSTWKMNSADEK